MIDPRDVGAAAAAVLATEDHDGRMYVLTGPEAISYAEVARELSTATGRDVEYVVSTMHTAHPDLRFAIDDLVAEGDRVTIRWTLYGTNTGPLFGQPPTGLPVERAAIVIFRITDGRITERWAGWKRNPLGEAPGPAA